METLTQPIFSLFCGYIKQHSGDYYVTFYSNDMKNLLSIFPVHDITRLKGEQLLYIMLSSLPTG